MLHLSTRSFRGECSRRGVRPLPWGSVLNSASLFEYLDTMVMGAIEIERAGRRDRERERPKPQEPGNSVVATLMFIFELAALFVVSSMHSLSPPET